MLFPRQAKDLYDKTANFYNRRYKSVQFEKYRRALTDIDLSGKVLDVGSGTGLLSEFLGKKVISCDISIKMLKQGKSKNVQADMAKLPFKSNSFDSVLSFSALMNSNNVKETIAEIYRVMKKEGIFIVSYLKKFNFSEPLENKFKLEKIIDYGEDICFILSKP